jgi:hypothetical protein
MGTIEETVKRQEAIIIALATEILYIKSGRIPDHDDVLWYIKLLGEAYEQGEL